MHRQQKTLTPSSLILPLAVTALVIFLASSANAQNSESTNVDLPPSLEDLAAPREARLAPTNSTTTANGTTSIQRSNSTFSTEGSLDVTSTTSTDNPERALSTKRFEWANAVAARREAIQLKIERLSSSTITMRAALSSEAKERMRPMTQNSIALLSTAIERSKNVSIKLRAQAEAINVRGIDTAEAVNLLDQADALIAQAESSLSGVDINIEYALSSEAPRENWVDAKAQLQMTAEIIRTVRPLLQEAITILRNGLRNSVND